MLSRPPWSILRALFFPPLARDALESEDLIFEILTGVWFLSLFASRFAREDIKCVYFIVGAAVLTDPLPMLIYFFAIDLLLVAESCVTTDFLDFWVFTSDFLSAEFYLFLLTSDFLGFAFNSAASSMFDFLLFGLFRIWICVSTMTIVLLSCVLKLF